MKWMHRWIIILTTGMLSACTLSHSLHNAAYQGDLDTVKTLVAKGADVHQNKTTKGRTALHMAAMNGHVNVVSYLLAHEAHIDKQDNYGFTALHLAVWKNRVAVINYLISQGADVNNNHNPGGYTPLHIAALRGNTTITEQLINAGVLTTSKSAKGYTAMGYAQKYRHRGVINLLRLKGLDNEKKS